MTREIIGYDNNFEYTVSGFDTSPEDGGIFVFTNKNTVPRIISASEIDFGGKRIMIFNADGKLIEAGGDIYANSDVVWGSPQLTVTLPCNGFMVLFNQKASDSLFSCYTAAMEGAVLYNATMAIAFDVRAGYDTDKGKLFVKYNNAESPNSKARRFLFVGNSATYFNGTPIQFKALAKAAGQDIVVDYCTYGSAFLSQYADEANERGIAFRSKLKEGNYDYVVLQDAAGATYEETKEQVKILVPLIGAAGSEALLYMRYGYDSKNEDRFKSAQRHHDTYKRLSQDFGLTCAPAADAFAFCLREHPDINLYADDGSHHSSAGAYLIACVWLKAFLGTDPWGNAYIATQSNEAAAKLQRCAKLVCERFL